MKTTKSKKRHKGLGLVILCFALLLLVGSVIVSAQRNKNICPGIGDLNNDGIVNAFDLARLLGAWGVKQNTNHPADLNHDGVVNSNDVDILIANWGVCPLAPVCGNNILETGEQCDGSELNGQTCQILGFQGGILSCSAQCTFDVIQCYNFDFSLSNDGDKVVTAGDSVDNDVTATLVSGVAQSVLFSVSGLPLDASATFSSDFCNPTCLSTMIINTAETTIAGDYVIEVTGTSGGLIKTTQFILTVNEAPVNLVWTYEDELNPSEISQDNNFGYSVAIDENVAIVGARYVDVNDQLDAGTAYIFRKTNNQWVQEAILTADDGQANDYFGYTVAVDDNTAVVGAYGDDENGNIAGAAYVFAKEGDQWVQKNKLYAPAGEAHAFDLFGYSVGVSGNRIIVGASTADGVVENAGAAYIFNYDGSNWVFGQEINSGVDALAYDHFGTFVAIDGNYLIVGAEQDDDAKICSDSGCDAGAAYIFNYDGVNWVQQSQLIANDAAVFDLFGVSVDISGDAAIVGAFAENSFKGAAYVFRRNGNQWNQETKLTLQNGAISDSFGYSVGISQDQVIVGSYGRETAGVQNAGAAYIYLRDAISGEWNQETAFPVNNLPILGIQDNFGFSVGISQDQAIVGAPFSNPDGISDAGASYVFVKE